MEKELPSKFRFKANGFYYLAELSTQADAYALSQTDEHGKDIRNLNHQALKESVQRCVAEGHWKIIEEAFELPSKFTFTLGSVNYTGTKQEDNSFIISWDKSDFCSQGSYPYTYENVMSLVKNKSWKISELIEVAPEEKTEPTLLDVIKEFVDTTKSEVTILPQGKWNVSCSFLSDDVVVDNEDELKKLLAATSSIIKMAVGKMANGDKK